MELLVVGALGLVALCVAAFVLFWGFALLIEYPVPIIAFALVIIACVMLF